MMNSLHFIRKFLAIEAVSGMLLLAMIIIAMVFAGFWPDTYYAWVNWSLPGSHHSLNQWIHHGLMSLFFLVVGLELKREISLGELNTPSKMMLPGITAIAGMLVPALIFFICNANHPAHWRGWSIPIATDIAFALGILSLLGRKVPVSLKVFLTALAIIDDLGAIVVIGFGYAQQLQLTYLVAAIGVWLGLLILNRCQVKRLSIYLSLGLGLWWLVLNSGVDATLSGVMLAMAIPLEGKPGQESPLQHLEHCLHPWVAYLILPVFALTHAGIDCRILSFTGLSFSVLLSLVLGKPLGIAGAAWLSIRCGWSELPTATNWQQFMGAALLCGIGFTMSLLLNELAFQQEVAMNNQVRLGIFLGSMIAALLGLLLLATSRR